jgi:hypothetical protein
VGSPDAEAEEPWCGAAARPCGGAGRRATGCRYGSMKWRPWVPRRLSCKGKEKGGEDEEAHAGATVVKTEEAGAHRIEAKRKETASARRPRHGSVCHAGLERKTGRRRGAPRLSRQVEVDVVPGAARRACRV